MSNRALTDLPEWDALLTQRKAMDVVSIADLFADDAKRFESFHVTLDGLVFDYSKHRVNKAVMSGLVNLAHACDLEARRDQMFAGDIVNESEDRAALHTALRGDAPVIVRDEVQCDFRSFCDLVERLRARHDLHDVIVVGVGGSMVAPHMVCEALAPFSDGPRMHFLSNVDGQSIETLKENLCPEHTIVVVISKTFTTAETMLNATSLKAWASEDRHIAVTENCEAAEAFGMLPENILRMRDWTGGRFSVWSAVGLPVALSVGMDRFKEFLGGGHEVDQHFRTASFETNIPVLMAMLGIWSHNFWNYPAHAVSPYADQLRFFTSYIQQLDMESNGKSVTQDGRIVDYKTGPVILGDVGTDVQHAFFQHLHQGTDITPVDFLVFSKAVSGYDDHHMKLVSNALAQAQALMNGRENVEAPHKHFTGNRPSSMMVFDELTPRTLGMLLALYEHKIFVQGVIWGINSFDQWGVELGKILAHDIQQSFETSKTLENADSSTIALMDIIKKTNLW